MAVISRALRATILSAPLTLDSVRASIEIDTDSQTDTSLQRLLNAAEDMVLRWAPSAPYDIQDEAMLRCIGWMANHPSFSLKGSSAVGVRRSYDTEQLSALRHSGAMALLSPYKVRRAGVI